jgi:hypothetical protein
VAILVLRSMARRWRVGESLDQQVPYGPGEERAAPLVAGGSD